MGYPNGRYEMLSPKVNSDMIVYFFDINQELCRELFGKMDGVAFAKIEWQFLARWCY